ncbi:MAG: PEP-CTERM sorting domain-containing protein [Anaerohalosphaera sp.]|nr:PEP-CTERM sorting domain-containing protein [Anaerohalosphaera sp.]
MKKLIIICTVIMVTAAITGTATAGWETFVIRNSSTGSIAPTITEGVNGDTVTNGTLFQIALGGQKAGWGTNDMNGMTVGDIESLSITRDSTVTGYGPYFNIWITDGNGNYAVIANEPSNTGEWGSGTPYDTTWDILKDATAKVYETDGQPFVLPAGPTYTFADFADYTIVTPTSHWGGTGAPDDLNAASYTAYGFNWVFGDTQSNYLGGHLVANPTLVPEPATMGLLSLGALVLRRKRK